MLSPQRHSRQKREGSLKVHRSRSVRRAKVTLDGKNLVSHAGAALLAELADRSGLTRAMSVAMSECGISWHTHDPGVVLTHLGVAIADGADCLADLAAFVSGPLRPGRLGGHGVARHSGNDVGRTAGHSRRPVRGSTASGTPIHRSGRSSWTSTRRSSPRIRRRRTPLPHPSVASGSTPSACGATTPMNHWPPS